MSRVSVSIISTDSLQNLNVKKDQGHFTFLNGDSYDGGYMIVKDTRFLTRQGRGIYLTADFDRYEAVWVEDKIINELKICHNNGTQYNGTIDINGEMSGFGTYKFVDNSLLEAIWEKNKPVAEITLKDPSGMIWRGEIDGIEINFTAGNHFWDEINISSNDDDEEEEDEKDLDIGVNYDSVF